jgi:hypothetical protein
MEASSVRTISSSHLSRRQRRHSESRWESTIEAGQDDILPPPATRDLASLSLTSRRSFSEGFPRAKSPERSSDYIKALPFPDDDPRRRRRSRPAVVPLQGSDGSPRKPNRNGAPSMVANYDCSKPHNQFTATDHVVSEDLSVPPAFRAFQESNVVLALQPRHLDATDYTQIQLQQNKVHSKQQSSSHGSKRQSNRVGAGGRRLRKMSSNGSGHSSSSHDTASLASPHERLPSQNYHHDSTSVSSSVSMVEDLFALGDSSGLGDSFSTGTNNSLVTPSKAEKESSSRHLDDSFTDVSAAPETKPKSLDRNTSEYRWKASGPIACSPQDLLPPAFRDLNARRTKRNKDGDDEQKNKETSKTQSTDIDGEFEIDDRLPSAFAQSLLSYRRETAAAKRRSSIGALPSACSDGHPIAPITSMVSPISSNRKKDDQNPFVSPSCVTMIVPHALSDDDGARVLHKPGFAQRRLSST